MHDIICPNCGEKFLGYEVAFNMSEFILPLLYYNAEEKEAVVEVGFKYYVDEEEIRKSNPQGDVALLACNDAGGPGNQASGFPFVVNGKTLFNYVVSKSGRKEEDFIELMESLSPVIERKRFQEITGIQLAQISLLYHVLFSISKELVDELDVNDEHVRTALKVLNHIYKNREEEGSAQSLFFDACIYSRQIVNKKAQHVPDILFIKHNGMFVNINKCCRYCGGKLPVEFGYYKIKPVVLLGSHSAGKTSYLLALLYSASNKAPFVGPNNEKIAVSTLNDDDNLEAFMRNINLYEQGKPPVKTDFSNVPILNLKVQDTIYSFIDWPGEKFISGGGADRDYIYNSKRVITRASHILFFLAPEQVDINMPTAEENVRFPLIPLRQSLDWHIAFPNSKKFKSLSYVINKVDMLESSMLFNGINGKDDSYVYNTSFDNARYDEIEKLSKTYISNVYPGLLNVLDNVNHPQISVKKHYMPAAPYGKTVTSDGSGDGFNLNQGFFNGLPFLRILKDDGLI